MIIEKMSESEIDGKLSRLTIQSEQHRVKLRKCWDDLHAAVGDTRQSADSSRLLSWTMTPTEVQRAACRTQDHDIALKLGLLEQAKGALEVVGEKRKELTNEWDRRGGWNRVYLVQGPGGHAHSSPNCPTCHRGERPTQFAWLTEYSGKTEEEIVSAAGERACTVCYPSAPVEALEKPSEMFGPEEITKQEEREKREAKAEAKRKKAEANAITSRGGESEG